MKCHCKNECRIFVPSPEITAEYILPLYLTTTSLTVTPNPHHNPNTGYVSNNPTHGLDGQHQEVDRTPSGTVSHKDRDKWKKYVHGLANPRIEDG